MTNLIFNDENKDREQAKIYAPHNDIGKKLPAFQNRHTESSKHWDFQLIGKGILFKKVLEKII